MIRQSAAAAIVAASTWLNAGGAPVAMAPATIQLDLPSEQNAAGQNNPLTVALRILSINWGGVLGAVIQLVIAMMTGNTAAIATAIQALITAIMGG